MARSASGVALVSPDVHTGMMMIIKRDGAGEARTATVTASYRLRKPSTKTDRYLKAKTKTNEGREAQKA